jgi:hypothetical protein
MSGLCNVPIDVAAASATSYFCGIDIGKRKHMALFLDSAGRVVRSALPVLDTRGGFAQFIQELQNLKGNVAIAVEATGHYWLALYECLSSQGFDVVVLEATRSGSLITCALHSRNRLRPASQPCSSCGS